MQAVVVRWMARNLDRLHWPAERWAREAGLNPTTVTRAMSTNYNSISSVPTLHALARAAGVPSILDFLDGQGNLAKHYPILTVMLTELLPVVGCRIPQEQVMALAQALGEAINGMSQQAPEDCMNPEIARALARAAKAAMYREMKTD